MNTLREEIAEIVRKHEPDWEVREEDKRLGIESFNDEQATAAFQARLPKKKGQTEVVSKGMLSRHDTAGWNAYADAVNEVLGGTNDIET